ncbi:hypothetical protein [Chryseobacterium indologenes]|uniref:hypothetical protein n=1 Tax=Chryseobacterium indologenes TaxID=253 RepID=UPI00405A1EED
MKIILLVVSIFIFTIPLRSQLQDKINIKSPESYSLEKYGNVPFNLYEGTIDLKIPIVNTDLVDLVLSYDSSGFLPHKKSGIVGTGWSLLAGGRITRTINRVPDQYVGSPPGAGNLFGTAVDIHGFLTGVRMNPYTNSTVYSVNNPNTSGFANDWAWGPQNKAYETEPDIFNFNIMNLHGKFMIGNDGKVRVESNDPDLKVDITGMSTLAMSTCKPNDDEIILTDGKGNRYYFGGDFSTYEINYDTFGYISNNINYATYPKILAYSISKIVLSNGTTINFNYMTGTFDTNLDSDFCQLHYGSKNFLLQNSKLLSMESFYQNGYAQSDFYNCDPLNTSQCFNTGSTTTFEKENHSLIKKSLLESIKYDNVEIKLIYKDAGYSIKQSLLNEGLGDKLYLNETVIDYIELLSSGKSIEKTNFSYFDDGGVDTMRPFLKEIIQEKSGRKYSFGYYSTNSLPAYYTKGMDHWGYWNGKDNNTSLAPFDSYNFNTGDYTLNNTFRDTNSQLYNVGLLSKITYPTKGYSVFEYEPRYYGKRVERISTSNFFPTLTNNSGLSGGARIKRQYDYAENGDIINDKTFQYTTSFNGNTSSGILMNWPRYFYYIEFLTSSGGVVNRKVLRTSSNIQQNSLDNYNVGYSKIFEIDKNKGYTEHNFTSYEDYPDLQPDNGNIKMFLNFSSPLSSPENLYKNFNNMYGIDRSILRGRPKSDLIYNLTSELLRRTDYEYTDNINFNPNSQTDENNYVSIHHLSGYWVQGYKKYFNSSVIKKKTVIDFLDGNEVKNTTENYFESSNHLNISSQKILHSDNVINGTIYNYAYEKGNQLMIDKNMVGIPLETTTTQTIGTTTKTLSRSETIYPLNQSEANTKTSGLVLPISVLSYNLQNPTSATMEVIYDKYDPKGNLQQFTTKDGLSTVIIWGYNLTQPIAKIEGAKLTDIQQSLIDSIVTASNTDASASANNDETSFLSVLNTFRNSLPNYQITTYTYDPLIGVRSITPPSGIREVYIYDSANRLKEIRENSQTGNLLKEFKYNYKQ